MKNILVLGGSGMLGSMVVDVFAQRQDFKVTATLREAAMKQHWQKLYPNITWEVFDGLNLDIQHTTRLLSDKQWAVNAIGITKPLIKDDNPKQTVTALRVNSLLPHHLGEVADARQVRVLQIATDCVFSGVKGQYQEQDPHDALDVYGKTKSLGEAWNKSLHHLRCSIIGPEPKENKFLIAWFLGQPRNGQVNGYTNHLWNGVTTLQFAKAAAGIIAQNIDLPRLLHLVPKGTISKEQMLQEFAKAYDRKDIQIQAAEAKTVIDRTLATQHPELNARVWQAAGFQQPPTVAQMIAELGAYSYRPNL